MLVLSRILAENHQCSVQWVVYYIFIVYLFLPTVFSYVFVGGVIYTIS